MEGIEHDLDKMRGHLKRGYDTPVKRISTKRTWSWQSEMMSEESNIIMPQERKNRSWIVGKERIEKKMTTSAPNELGIHPSKKVITELLEKPTTKRVSLLWAYGKHLITMRWNSATNEKQDWIDKNKEARNLFHREDKWRTWVIYKHHK